MSLSLYCLNKLKLMLYWLSAELISAYVYSTAAFLLLTLFIKEIRQRTPGFLQTTNSLIIIILFFNLLLKFHSTRQCIVALLLFLVFLTFLFKKIRVKPYITFASILLLLVYLNSGLLQIVITSLFRDYFPSTWSTYYANTNGWWTIAFSAIWFCICYLGASRSIVKST